jgi:hypothetical protein
VPERALGPLAELSESDAGPELRERRARDDLDEVGRERHHGPLRERGVQLGVLGGERGVHRGVDGAALVCLCVKALRARAATRLQAAGRGLLARRLRLRLYRQSRPYREYLNTFYGTASMRTWVESHVLAF